MLRSPFPRALALTLGLTLAACGSKEASPDPSATGKPAPTGAAPGTGAAATPPATPAAPSKVDRKPTAEFSGDEAGARKLLTRFLDPTADRKALTAALQPDPADYTTVFTPDLAPKLEAAAAKIWSSGEAVSGKPGQTEVLLSSATTDDFKAWNDKADNFPGGYKKIVDKLQPGVVLYRWKFVEPGKKIGMAFDGLAFVNGHWAWFPKPWRDAGGP